jgi:hypothetical protein
VDAPVSFTLDAAPVPVLDELRSDRWFAASLVINHDGQGDPRATVVSDNAIGLVALRPDTIDEFAERVSKILSDTAKEPDSYRPVEGEASRKLLAELARRGSSFYDQLIHDTPVLADRLRAAPRIQIVAATSDSWLPAELLYRFTPPREGATVCVPGVAALADPDPDADCDADHDENVVCPMGFWSLCKVTERHAFVLEDTNLRHPFALYDAREFPIAPVLRPLRRALLGASDLTDEVDTHASEKLMDETAELTTTSEQAESWDEWKDQIKDLEPSLLVLLPHHWKQGSAEGLEISGDRLDAALILDPVVRAEGSVEPPVVLLMGCKTTATRVAFDSFVQKFRRHGAAVVVSTYATVLGRQVAPVTARLLKELSERMSHGDVRMGDALLTIRRQLVAEGMPLGLSLTAYGDADCRLRST